MESAGVSPQERSSCAVCGILSIWWMWQSPLILLSGNKWLERSDCERSRRNDQMAYKESQSMIPWWKKDHDSLGIKRGHSPPLKMLTTIEFCNLGEDWLGATYLGHLWAFLSNNLTCYHLQLSSWGVDDVVQMIDMWQQDFLLSWLGWQGLLACTQANRERMLLPVEHWDSGIFDLQFSWTPRLWCLLHAENNSEIID